MLPSESVGRGGAAGRGGRRGALEICSRMEPHGLQVAQRSSCSPGVVGSMHTPYPTAATARTAQREQTQPQTQTQQQLGRSWAAAAAAGGGQPRGLRAAGGWARRTQLVAPKAIDAPDFKLEPRPSVDPFERVVHVDRVRPHSHLLLLPRGSGARRWEQRARKGSAGERPTFGWSHCVCPSTAPCSTRKLLPLSIANLQKRLERGKPLAPLSWPSRCSSAAAIPRGLLLAQMGGETGLSEGSEGASGAAVGRAGAGRN